MKLIPYVLLGFVLVTSLASAQTDSTERAKMIGLRFSFNGLNLGGGLGGKYWLSSQSAVAGGLGFVTRSYVSGNTEASFNIFGQYEHHFLQKQQISPYLAGGFNLGIGSSDNFISSTTRFLRPFTDAGISAIVGVEFFITPAISLAGQQAFTASYTRQDISNPSFPQLTLEYWSVGIGSSSLIFHIYFGHL